MKNKLRDYLVRTLNELLTTKKQYQKINIGTEFAKLEWFIFDNSKHARITDSNVYFINCMRSVLVKSNLNFGYSIVNYILTVESRGNLKINDIKNCKTVLHKLDLSNDNYTGKLYHFNSLNPNAIRLAKLDDLINVVNNLLKFDDKFIKDNK